MGYLKNTLEAIGNALFARRMPIPNGLDSSAIAENDDDLCWAALAEAREALKRAKGDPDSKVKLLPRQWRRICTLAYLDSNIINGGFHQFFTNAGGMYDSHLLEDIEEFGHEQLTHIVRQAWKKYSGQDYSDQWKNRGKSWDFFVRSYEEGRFDAEDQAYEEFVGEEWLTPHIIGRHVRANFHVFALTSSSKQTEAE